jgi:hypothetical protein
MACGPARVRTDDPRFAPRGYNPAGFNVDAIRGFVTPIGLFASRLAFPLVWETSAPSRSITTLAHRFEQGTNCSPAERCVQYAGGVRGGG